MIFRQMLPGQKLILARIETPQPLPRPIVARSTHRPNPEPILTILIIWLIQMFVSILPAEAAACWDSIRTNYAALAFLAGIVMTVILETIAADYVSQMVGAA